MAEVLDRGVTAAEAEDQSKYVIHEGKVIDLRKLDVDGIRSFSLPHLTRLYR